MYQLSSISTFMLKFTFCTNRRYSFAPLSAEQMMNEETVAPTQQTLTRTLNFTHLCHLRLTAQVSKEVHVKVFTLSRLMLES